MNIRRAYFNALTVFIIAGTLWAAPSAEAVVTNYRSIGTNGAELFNTGAASVVMGQTKVTFAVNGGRLPDTIGRGDEIVIDDEELYIFSRDSDTQLTLQTPALKEHKAEEFAIRRAYTSIQSWVNDRKGNLVRENRLEVGVCYNDGPFTTRKHWALAHIQGSKTDRDHFMWLTAAETAQHQGAAGKGVILDGLNRARCGILIEDNYTRVDGLELKNFGHCFVPAAVAVRYAKGVVLERLIVHDFDVRHRESFGIKGGVHSDFIARNCIIYNGGTAGIVTRWKTSKAAVENCTVFGMNGKGVDEGHGLISAVNTISMGSREDFAIRRGTQSNNISSDGTAAGDGSMAFLKPIDQFVSTEPGAEDFHLKDTSAAIDKGMDLSAGIALLGSLSSAAVAPADDPEILDIDGTDRAEEAVWDIGADEVESGPKGVWYVDSGKTGRGTSWKDAFATIEQAVSASTDGQEIWVKEGTYSLSSELIINRPMALYGGFFGNERKRDLRDWRQRVTLLDAPPKKPCLSFTAKGILVSGFTFSSGYSVYGGAVSALAGSGFVIENCRFELNEANYGGAFSSVNASGTILNCIFSANMAKSKGGAIYAEGSTLNIVNCIFTGNIAGLSSFAPLYGGGAVYISGPGAAITNCSFYNNGTRFLSNCGGAVYNNSTSPTTLTNCILWLNSVLGPPETHAAKGPHVYNNESSVSNVTYSFIDQAGFDDGTNIRDAIGPLWVDPGQENFQLQPVSPCIDAGTLDALGLPELDFEGDPRVSGAAVDIGACEFGD
jgi:predicted outer membrane repeat protein